MRVIILADDLAGAADCGVAFASRGLRTHAVLHADAVPSGDWDVLALDTDTRAADPDLARRRVWNAAAGIEPERIVFKKVDSTLRGHLACELAGLLAARRADLVLAAPAFPATGRTTVRGRQRLDGRPLEETEFAGQVRSSSVAELLEGCGLPVRSVGVGGALPEAPAVAVCDAETDEDLGALVRAGLAESREVVWLGSAGLARALAAELVPEPAAPALPRVGGPVVFVVGSPSRATREQLARLRDCSGLVELPVSEAAVARALREGRDCLVAMSEEVEERDAGEASRRLAAAVAGADPNGVALVLTGGETARAVLTELGVGSLELACEIGAGVAVGAVESPRRLVVAVKAGGFGGPDALVHCRRVLSSEREVKRAWISR